MKKEEKKTITCNFCKKEVPLDKAGEIKIRAGVLFSIEDKLCYDCLWKIINFHHNLRDLEKSRYNISKEKETIKKILTKMREEIQKL